MIQSLPAVALGSPGTKAALLLIAAAFAVWAAVFIASTSFVAWDGHRYFCLFDDAMISMRFADNLAAGQGLVWNAGERVEGYTNLLMTLLMVLPNAILEKRFAVLTMQIFGIVVALAVAGMNVRLAGELAGPGPGLDSGTLRVAAFALGLAYYPLVYWTLMGMETGLVTFLLLVCLVSFLVFSRRLDRRPLIVLAVGGGLAYLTRPDSVVVTAPLMALALGRAGRDCGWPRRTLVGMVGLFLLLPAAQMAFRIFYYGSLAPTTYTLKLGAFPLSPRLANGLSFLRPFFGQTWPLFLAASVGALAARRRLVALGVPLVLVAYQIAVGGDAWSYWRLVSPGMPILLLLALLGVHTAARRVPGDNPGRRRWLTPATVAGVLALVLAANRTFLPEIRLEVPPHGVEENRETVNAGLAVRALTHHTATVGVFQAGALPYYSERPAVDFLGKCDPHVASLPPDLSGAVAWLGMSTVPGHNKYDLNYSIKELRPTYIEGWAWGRQDLGPWVTRHYEQVVFEGQRLLFLRDSPFVDWRKLGRRRIGPPTRPDAGGVPGEGTSRDPRETRAR
jgi:arabinofuranosyltransferase